MLKNLMWALALSAWSLDALAVMKCTGNGKTWYQDAPCPDDANGTALQLNPTPAASTSSPKTPQRSSTSSPVAKSPAASTPQEDAAPSALEAEAEMCFAWYQKQASMTAGATYSISGKDRRVLTIQISMPYSSVNTAGAPMSGVTTTSASCEILNGTLDDGWTRTHARRGNWIP